MPHLQRALSQSCSLPTPGYELRCCVSGHPVVCCNFIMAADCLGDLFLLGGLHQVFLASEGLMTHLVPLFHFPVSDALNVAPDPLYAVCVHPCLLVALMLSSGVI